MDDFDEIMDNMIHSQARKLLKHNNFEEKKKRIPKHAVKPNLRWNYAPKYKFITDDRHLFVGLYDCYWCGLCTCCFSEKDKCSHELI